MSAQIIEFNTGHRAPRVAAEAPGLTLTTTAKNARLRAARREAWQKADAATDFWYAYLRFTDQVSRARAAGVKEAHQHAEESPEARFEILDRYREALGRQLLTPAPTLEKVNWKRSLLNKTHIGTKKEFVEKAIEDDIAFLNAHPTRTRTVTAAVS
jgi:hypothetical protein